MPLESLRLRRLMVDVGWCHQRSTGSDGFSSTRRLSLRFFKANISCFTADSPISFITFPRYGQVDFTTQLQGVSFVIWDGKARRWVEKKVMPKKIPTNAIWCFFKVFFLSHGPFGSTKKSPSSNPQVLGGCEKDERWRCQQDQQSYTPKFSRIKSSNRI